MNKKKKKLGKCVVYMFDKMLHGNVVGFYSFLFIFFVLGIKWGFFTLDQ